MLQVDREMRAAPLALLDSRSCWRSGCHCPLGSFSDSLPASLPAGSSTREGIVIDVLRGTADSIVGGRSRRAFMAVEQARVRLVPKPWGCTDLRPWNVHHDAAATMGEVWFERSDAQAPCPALL